jgi:hypothetical protein
VLSTALLVVLVEKQRKKGTACVFLSLSAPSFSSLIALLAWAWFRLRLFELGLSPVKRIVHHLH